MESTNLKPRLKISFVIGSLWPTGITTVFSVLQRRPLKDANASKVVLRAFRDSNSKIVPVVLSSANPSDFEVSKADSFLNFGSLRSGSGAGLGIYSRARSEKGLAIKWL
jgi:hypothetical protein